MLNSIVIGSLEIQQVPIMPHAQPVALRGAQPESKIDIVFRRLLFTMMVIGGLAACQYSADSGPLRVQRVIDGDSLRVTSPGQTVEVRIAGIDAPEYRQPYAEQAKALLRSLVLDQEVVLQNSDVDRYGRTVAVVIRASDRLDVNAELVRQGAAWAHPQYAQLAWFELEQQARAARRGLWGGKQPVPPWDWRRQHGTTYSRK